MPPLNSSKGLNREGLGGERWGRPSRQLGLGAGIGLGLAAIAVVAGQLAIAPVTAHQVRVADDIGGTLHIEPDDRPRAGESVLMWFALTRRGGTSLQLEDCDCKVQVFAQPVTDGATPVASPDLEPVAAENYSGIPGANVTFPEIGAYTIKISGSPVAEDDFQPFELSFDITVVSR